MNLSEDAKAKRREYMRKWRQKPENKKKQREYTARYWERKAQEAQQKKNAEPNQQE